MDTKANDTFAFDLENRLDDFFSDALSPQEEAPEETTVAANSDQPLKDLKSTILAIDWEITDSALQAFIGQVDTLSETYKSDKVVLTLLKLLKSLGKYIKKHKSGAHPDTIKRIMAVYTALEEVVGNAGLGQDEKEHMLGEEIRQFQQLKAKIVEKRIPARVAPSKTETTANTGIEAVIAAIEELKATMAAELGTIRKELARINKK